MELTSKQRAQLRGMANGIDTILHIGKDGIGENLIRQANEALEARELVKGRVLDNNLEYDARKAAEELAAACVSLDEIVAKIREIVEHDSDEDGYMPLSQVGVMLSRIYADFDSRNYGFSKLHKLIDYTKAFETKYEQFENGGKNLVIRNKG